MEIQCSYEYCDEQYEIPDGEVIGICPRCCMSTYVYDAREWETRGQFLVVMAKAFDFVSHVGHRKSETIIGSIYDRSENLLEQRHIFEKLFKGFGARLEYRLVPYTIDYVDLLVVLED